MITKKLFLASSTELKADRAEFEVFIGRKNKDWIGRGVFFELVIWEDFLDAVSQTRLQDEYNSAIRGCDLFVMLFWTKVGRYTEEEFETAFGHFKAENKPIIFTYFKKVDVNPALVDKKDLANLRAFKDKLATLGHFYTVYRNADELKFKFNQQLDKLVANGSIELVSGIDPIIARVEQVVPPSHVQGTGSISGGTAGIVGAGHVRIENMFVGSQPSVSVLFSKRKIIFVLVVIGLILSFWFVYRTTGNVAKENDEKVSGSLIRPEVQEPKKPELPLATQKQVSLLWECDIMPMPNAIPGDGHLNIIQANINDENIPTLSFGGQAGQPGSTSGYDKMETNFVAQRCSLINFGEETIFDIPLTFKVSFVALSTGQSDSKIIANAEMTMLVTSLDKGRSSPFVVYFFTLNRKFVAQIELPTTASYVTSSDSTKREARFLPSSTRIAIFPATAKEKK